MIIPSADRVGRLFPLPAASRPPADLEAFCDTIVPAIGEASNGDRLVTAPGDLFAEDGGGAPAGWFLPDENEPAMPHPLDGPGSETIGAMLS